MAINIYWHGRSKTSELKAHTACNENTSAQTFGGNRQSSHSDKPRLARTKVAYVTLLHWNVVSLFPFDIF